MALPTLARRASYQLGRPSRRRESTPQRREAAATALNTMMKTMKDSMDRMIERTFPLY
jgi:hypothetical protein